MADISGLESYPYGEHPDDPQQSFAGAERLIHWIVDGMVKVFRARPKYVDRAFPLLQRSERDKIKRILAEFPLEVVHGFPNESHARKGAKVVASIIVSADAFELGFLDSFIGAEIDEVFSDLGAAAGSAATFGEIDTTDFGIWIWATHPDLMIYYYNLIWVILLGGFKIMLERDVSPISISGNDIRPDPQFLPQFSYIRRIALKVRGARTSALDSSLVNEMLVSIRAAGLDGSEVVIGPIETTE